MNHGFMAYCASVQPLTSVIRSLLLIPPSPYGIERYQLQTSTHLSLGSYSSAIDLKAIIDYMVSDCYTNIRCWQITPASSLWPQLWSDMCGQSLSLVSDPVQPTLSMWMGPMPGVLKVNASAPASKNHKTCA